ncbi:Ttf2, partial [Symbiodinium pilosum]
MEPQRPPLRLVSERVGLQAVRRCNGSSLSHHPPLPHYALRGRLRQHRDHTTRRLGIPEFQAFEDFNGALGYNMKTSKRQPPATSHTIQGVIISTEPQHITLTPCPQRAQQMCEDFCEEIQLCLNRDQLDPDKARRMAGKCNFLTGRLFGKVGRAPLRAIYASAHSNISQLGKPTRSALHALLNITHHCKPTRLPLQIKHRQFAIIYTDTYHLAGETTRAWDFQGRLPQQILRQFSSNTAFIYLLEAWVAIIAPLICEPLLGQFYIQCCDNEDLDFFDPGGLHPGCKAPAYGWGGVKHGTIGFFLKTDGIRHELRSSEGPNVIVKWPTHEMWKGKQGEVVRADAPSGQQRPPLVLDLHVRAAYRVRGGILADKIGYGKTATTIALIDRQPAKPTPPIPEVDAGRFLPAKGTLIIVPSNLFEQWINEISKFVWDGRPLRQQMKGGWSPKDCPLKIFAMSNVSPLGRCKAGDISTADVVICSYRLLYSQIYLKRREELCSGTSLWNLPNQIRTFLAGQHGLRSGRKGAEVAQKWQDLEFPVLEMFYWKRIVFDEFHELESFESAQQNSLQFLRSHFRWGLTGTPPVENNAGAIFMSSLFRVDLPGYLQ